MADGGERPVCVCVVTFKHLALPGTLSGPAETGQRVCIVRIY
jgi:hypothetical protein